MKGFDLSFGVAGFGEHFARVLASGRRTADGLWRRLRPSRKRAGGLYAAADGVILLDDHAGGGITHRPTGIVVACQQERSQHKNKSTAMKMLRAAMYQKEVDAREAAKKELQDGMSDIAFGSQIRSYVFQPYTMVNDHRTELKITDVHGVMDGDLDPRSARMSASSRCS